MRPEGTRQRRPRGEPRRLLIEAAVELFNARGYSVPTREIADRAEVSETLMFRYFGSKAGLFREAMVKPFTDFVDSFVVEYERGARPDDDLFEITVDFVGRLYDLFRSHRGLVAAVWGNAGSEGSDLTASAVEEDVWAAFGKLVRVGRLARTGRPANNDIATRAIVSMIAGMAVADRAFEGGSLPSRDLIVYELAQIATYGRVRWDVMPAPDRFGRGPDPVTSAG